MKQNFSRSTKVRMTSILKDVCVIRCCIQNVESLEHGIKKIVEQGISRNIKKADFHT
jgi:hypothetical protein